VSVTLVWLALLMGAVTYPSRAVPMLAPGLERLPPMAFRYLRLVGPAVLGALAAVNTVVVADDTNRGHLHVGVVWLAVAVCIALVTWRKNLFLGLISAVVLAALARAANLA
jgi:branched-subunit amino acid transport protein